MSPEAQKSPLALNVYLALVSACGGCVVVGLAIFGFDQDFELSLVFVALALAVFIGEYVLIQVGGTNGEETISTTFVLALLLTHGVAAAVITQVAASLLADVVTRKRLDRGLFNSAQLALSWAGAGLIITLLTASPGEFEFTPLQLLSLLPAMATFFVINSTLVRTAEALALGFNVSAHLKRDLVARAWPAAMLMGLGPPVAALATTDLLLVPLVVFPIVAIHRAARQATQMEELALHDSLTQLPSRLLFEDLAGQALLGAKRTRDPVAVMLLDLDGFKAINDTLGHEHGDALLRNIGDRLRNSAQGETVARLGGDEFAILLRNIAEPTDAAAVAQRLLSDLAEPITLDALTITIQGSMGVACFPNDGEDVQTLLRHADAAMYAAKRTPERYRFFLPDRDFSSPGRLAMASALKQALEAGEIDVHYQPKVNLDDRSVRSVEALSRWTGPGRSPVPPSEFIPVAEHTGLIVPLTAHVLGRALDDCAAWRRSGLELGVAVNLSVRSMFDRGLPSWIANLLRDRRLEPDCLELEITESVLLVDADRARKFVAELREIGVRLTVDDFGTGYSSLAYLKDLPIDCVKIDRSFVEHIETLRSDANLVKSIIDLGHNLGLQVVAEGVETEGMLHALTAMNCDTAQGYFFSRAVPYERVPACVRKLEQRTTAAVI